MVLEKVIKSELKGELRLILFEHQGRYQAIPGRELAKMLGHRDDRQIRLAIRELIKNGLPVASSTLPPAGYFLATTKEEAEEYMRSVKGRLVEDAYRLRDFKRAARDYLEPGQRRLL